MTGSAAKQRAAKPRTAMIEGFIFAWQRQEQKQKQTQKERPYSNKLRMMNGYLSLLLPLCRCGTGFMLKCGIYGVDPCLCLIRAIL